MSNSSSVASFSAALKHYDSTLKTIEKAESPPSDSKILALLCARDTLASALSELALSESSSSREEPATGETEAIETVKELTLLYQLDLKLKQQAPTIVAHGHLADWRNSFNPPPEAWWWRLETIKIPKAEEIKRFKQYLDWIFNGLTLLGLLGVATFTTSFIQLFGAGGFGPLESFGLIGQSGLLLTAVGSLGGEGKKKIEEFLQVLGVPRRFLSLFSLTVSSLLFLGSVSVYRFIPKIAESYFDSGLTAYESRKFTQAENDFKQALRLDQQNANFNLGLGSIYETLSQNEAAITQYQIAIGKGSIRAINNLARIYLVQGDLVKAETLLFVGLQAAQRQQQVSNEYHLYKNLGWLLLQKGDYEAAEQALKQAIERENVDMTTRVGTGLSYCYFAQTQDKLGQTQAAKPYWENCINKAIPETLGEMKWFIKVGRGDILQQIDLSAKSRTL